MVFALTLFASLAASQGQVLSLSLPAEPALEAAEVRWAGRDVPFVRTAAGWTTVIGVDLDAPPGAHAADMRLRYAGGRTELRSEPILVSARSFPTTALQVEPGYVELSPENQARAARESAETAAIYAALTPERYWHSAFQSPIPGATGGRNFGHRRVFNGQARAPHSGADLRASTGTPILAANRGRVVLAKDLFFSGNAVFLDHGLGVYSVYLHLSEIRVATGQMIERGAVLGLAGATGRVTGPHLHWGVRVLDARVDPFTLLELPAD
jgi:murein DD-endopeptidase MepM/ murein hydrolase activator NlpD